MIAIKDMKMPKNCEVCDFRKSDPYSGEEYCVKAIGSNTIIYEKERLENCPLVEIVTCKDCKYTRQNEDNDWYCDLSGRYYDPNYYCTLGER